ncbi:S-layer homology domain-containing protein [Cohnella sp.]|uniref:S-layer homology domain-containing protein n=1 Tax=Cohnella sp. TaxID=1883426 RepID=UPI003561BE4A
MKSWKKLLAAALALLLAVPAVIAPWERQTHAAAAGVPSLRITEIVPKSGGTGQPYEYVEIYNATSSDIDLNNYQLQYYASTDLSKNPSNRWTIANKTIPARSALVLWLIKLEYPLVQLDDFNRNYGEKLAPNQIYRVQLTTSAQGLHDSAPRAVAIAEPNGSGGYAVVSSAFINDTEADGITNRSVIYAEPVSDTAMVRIANGQTATPGWVVDGQVRGPLTPAGLTAMPGDSEITLAWNGNDASAAGYRIYGGAFAQPVTVAGSVYQHTIGGLTAGIPYSFRVTAYDNDGNESPSTAEATAVPLGASDAEPPAVPSGLRTQVGPDFVHVLWDAVSDADLKSYRVYVDGIFHAEVDDPRQNTTIASLTKGRSYTFEVSALDASGNESPKSAPVQTKPADTLLITELVPDTDNYASYDAFEYIEMYNATSAEIDLKGFTLQSGNWSYTFPDSNAIGPWSAKVVWTRRTEISPITWEGFNQYYLLDYRSKDVTEHTGTIINHVGGLVNTGSQTVTLLDPMQGLISKAVYNGSVDTSLGTSVAFGYPQDGTANARITGTRTRPTPGWILAGQAPEREALNPQPPQQVQQLRAAAGEGAATLMWQANAEEDLYAYNIYLDGAWEASVPATLTSFEVQRLIGNKSYSFTVTAVNTSGFESAPSATAQTRPEHWKLSQTVRSDSERSPAYQTTWDLNEDGPIIPGLDKELVPQGVGYSPADDWLLVVYYSTDGRPGIIAVIEAESGRLVKSIELYEEDGSPYVGHAGGVTVSRSHVWISSEGFLYRMNLSDVVGAADRGEVRFAGRVPVVVNSAYSTYADGVLWVGEFYQSKDYPTDPSHHMLNRDGETYSAWIAGYELDGTTDEIKAERWDGTAQSQAVPDYLLSVPDMVQGAVVTGDHIYLSTSYGRNKDSLLYRYMNPTARDADAQVAIGQANVPLWFLDSHAEPPYNSRLTTVPMSEGMTSIGNRLYVLLESGANKYRYTTTYIMERMLKLNMDHWDSYGQDVIAGLPQTLTVGESARAQVHEVRGNAPEIDRTAGYSFSVGSPGAATVTTDGTVAAVAAGEAVIVATQGDRQLAYTLKVVPANPGNGGGNNGGDRGNSGTGPIEGGNASGSGGDGQSVGSAGNNGVRPITGDEQTKVRQAIQRAGSAARADLTPVADAFEFDAASGAKEVKLTLSGKLPDKPIGVYKVEASGALIYVGGTVANGVLRVKLRDSGVYAVLAFAKVYGDLPSANFAYESVLHLSAMQVVEGTGGTNFSPEQPVTRAQFIAMLARLLGLKAAASAPGFGDVPAGAWYAEAASAAKEAGLVTGDAQGLLNPNGIVSREQMAALLVRAYELSAGNVQSAPNAPFADYGHVSGWAKKELDKAYAAGLVNGRSGGKFAPQDRTNRAEAAKALHNLFVLVQRNAEE